MKRLRPLMGTYFGIRVEAEGPAVERAVEAAFATAQRLEKLVSRFEPESWPNRFNRWDPAENCGVPDEIFPLFQMAFTLYQESRGAFDPFTSGGDLDLTGIAKGWIVDRVAEQLEAQLPDAEICVNAGGDLRFVNSPRRPVTLRTKQGFKKFEIERNSVAVSSLESEHPSTAYHKTSKLLNVAVMHDSCAMADALTKVALFSSSPEEVLAKHGAKSVVV